MNKIQIDILEDDCSRDYFRKMISMQQVKEPVEEYSIA